MRPRMDLAVTEEMRTSSSIRPQMDLAVTDKIQTSELQVFDGGLHHPTQTGWNSIALDEMQSPGFNMGGGDDYPSLRGALVIFNSDMSRQEQILERSTILPSPELPASGAPIATLPTSPPRRWCRGWCNN